MLTPWIRFAHPDITAKILIYIGALPGHRSGGSPVRIPRGMEVPEILCKHDLKYLCRICKRKFACGRALGGHMRAHGEDEEEEEGLNSTYSLRRNPKRNWRFADRDFSFLEAERNPKEIWEKGESGIDEEEDMAKCLVMLASGARKLEESPEGAADSSSTSARADAELAEEDSAPGHVSGRKSTYECKTCGKIFHTYQALGGHRASHRKIKGCSAGITLLQNFPEFSCGGATEDIADATCASTRAPKVHECSICHRTFASGQALGGHKRCHFLISDAKKPRRIKPPAAVEELLDLNLPAPPEDDATWHARPADVEPPRSIAAPCWWMDGDSKHGLFL